MPGDSSDWASDSYPQYRLTRQIVLNFLKRKFNQNGDFSDSDFNVKFSADDFTFRVPQRLTLADREELRRERLRGNDDEE
ncbi:hypothetical protein AOQ84DRAFT_378163 [Glonium stellatum]|uniref:Uncharacterized protein n=1 Tax=Glonium stellatum TaxID=574774 RepID=A0A8E2EXV9_9PEZI|nr:hypothetical protein AOQ84DRAFT_378163 [Glonium stellatum]